MQQPPPNNNYNPQPSFNQNYHATTNAKSEDITDPHNRNNMATRLHCSTGYENMVQDRQMRMVGANGGISLDSSRAECLGIIKKMSKMQYQNVGVYNSEDWGSLAELYIRPRKGMRISSDTVDDCTKQATHRNDNVISDISCVEQEGGTVDQHTATVEETRAYFESLYNNLALEVEKCEECKYDKISYDKAYNDMQQKIERLQAQLGDLKGKSKDTPCVSNTLDPLSQKLENENVELEFQVNLTALDGIMLTSNPSNQKSNGSKFYFLLGRFRVAFQKEIPCFVQILKEFDSLKGNRSTNFTPSITSESICQSPNFPQGSSNIYKVLQSKYKENPRRNMNVNLMRLSQVFFEKSSSKPGLQSMTSGQISLGLDLTYAPSTITTQKPTECELDLLFEAMYDDYMVSIASAPRTARFSSTSAQQTPTATTTQQTQHRQPTNSYLSTTN
ncbi:hypothetical protein Tco_1226611 [Tanacetum coccineum]